MKTYKELLNEMNDDATKWEELQKIKPFMKWKKTKNQFEYNSDKLNIIVGKNKMDGKIWVELSGKFAKKMSSIFKGWDIQKTNDDKILIWTGLHPNDVDELIFKINTVGKRIGGFK